MIGKNILFLVLSMLTIFIFTGCGAKGQVFKEFEKPKKNAGIAYIYRPSSILGAAVYYDIHVTNKTTSNQNAGRLSNGGYVKVDLPVGENEIWGKTEVKSSVTLDIKDGTISCIKGGVGIGFIIGHPHLSIVDMATCSEEIKGTKTGYSTIKPNYSSVSLGEDESLLRCARMNNGKIIQEYVGILNIVNNTIIINKKDYSHKYIIMEQNVEELSNKGIKGHFCNLIRENNWKFCDSALVSSNILNSAQNLNNAILIQFGII